VCGAQEWAGRQDGRQMVLGGTMLHVLCAATHLLALATTHQGEAP
jgi:hypothetical protein